MLINTIRMCKCLSHRGIMRFSAGRKTQDAFIRGIFEGDLDSIKLKDTPDINRYSFIYNHKQINSDADLQSLAATLQYISASTRRNQKPTVDVDTYLLILRQYYERIDLLLGRYLNKHISPSYQLKYLLPSFIHTDNQQVLSLLKLKQLDVFELMGKSREISINEFMRIFSREVYNITDLPLLDDLLHLHFYPKLGQIESIYQLEQALEYLGRLQSLNILTIRKSYSIIKREIKKELLNEQISLDWYISLMHCLGTLNSCDIKTGDRKKVKLEQTNELNQLTAKLSEKRFEINGQIYKIGSLIKEQTLNQILSQLQSRIFSNIDRYKQSFSEQEPDSDFKVPQLVAKERRQQYNFLSKINKETIRKILTLEFMPKIIKTILSYRCMNISPTEQLQTFLKSSLFINFINQCPCYPNLSKTLIQSLHFLQTKYNISFDTSETNKHISTFRSKANLFLNEILKEYPDTIILYNFSPPRLEIDSYQSPQSLWNLEGSALLVRLMTANQDYTYNNLLAMLRQDSNFLQSRMKLPHKQFLKIAFEEQRETSKIQMDFWNYPYYYTFADVNQNIYGLVHHRFNQNTQIPKDCLQFTLSDLQSIKMTVLPAYGFKQ